MAHNKQISIWEEKDPRVRIHHPIVTAPFGYLEINSMRIFLLLLEKWDLNAPEDIPIRIPVKDFIPNYRGGTHFDQIKNAINELRVKMKDVRIEVKNPGKEKYTSMTIIDYIEHEKGKDYVEAMFGNKIKKYLMELKGNFTLAELREMFSFKSSYTVRLYLIGKTFYPGFTQLEMDVDDFRIMLCGEKNEAYREFKVFKRDVLNPHVKILSKSTAPIEIIPIREGRSIKKLVIRPAKPLDTSIEIVKQSSSFSKVILDQLTEYGVNLKKIAAMLNNGEINEEYIQYCINDKKSNKSIQKIGASIYNAVVQKQLWIEYQDFLMSRKFVKSLPKTSEPRKLKRFSEKELNDIYQTSIKKNRTTKTFTEWAKETYPETLFDRVKDIDGWYVVEKEIRQDMN